MILVLIGIGSFIYGAITLSRYGFRLGTGQGLAVLLFPPYTFYFAFFKLREEDTTLETASWVFGIVVTALLTFLFFPPLKLVLQGRFDELSSPENVGQAATEAYGKEDSSESDEGDSGDSEDSDDSASGSDSDSADDESSEPSGNSPDAGDDSGDAGSGRSSEDDNGE